VRSHQNRKGAEVGFAKETRRGNLRGIPSPKSERVRRTRIPTASLIIACSALPSGGRPMVVCSAIRTATVSTAESLGERAHREQLEDCRSQVTRKAG
jgi:hypothetical protein